MEMNNEKLEIAKDKSCSLEPMWYCTVDLIIGSLLKLTVTWMIIKTQ